MRLIHNFFQMFRKDDGAHFTYNIGVSFMRAFLILTLLAVLPSIPLAIKRPNTLSYSDSAMATVSYTQALSRTERIRTGDGNIEYHTYYDYSVTFQGEKSNGKTLRYTQGTTEQLYEHYKAIEHGDPRRYNIYKSDLNRGYYISEKDIYEAQAEYQSLYGSTGRIFNDFIGMIIPITSVIALIFLAIGIGEIRISMKYPRSDVPMTETAIMPAEKMRTDEIIREFDDAPARRKAGAPEIDPRAKALPDSGMEEEDQRKE